MADLIPFRRVHVVGAGGAGMSGLAKLMVQAGHQVTGSDLKPGQMLAALDFAGADTWVGHRPDTAVKADLVVASSAVPDTDPEVRAARDAGIPVWARPRLLAEVTRRRTTIGVTGTHGKTTGTAMAATALRNAGKDPSFMVGGRLVDLNTNAHLGAEEPFVLEADEAFGTFLSLDLEGLLVTNIEPDHLDHYGSVAAMEAAFAEVAGAVDGPVVGCMDDPGVRRLREIAPNTIGYGCGPDAHWRVESVEPRDGGVAFAIASPIELEVWVPQPGAHVALNAAGVVALLTEAGFDAAEVAAGLATYRGVRRRFEIRSRHADVTVVDDYAHHPTEVAATIAAARQAHEGRIVAVFQPHRFSRTEALGAELGDALSAADRVFVTEVYAAGEAPIPGVTGRTVLDGVSDETEPRFVARRVDVAARLADEVEAGDMVLLLGAGDITQVADELAPLLPRS